MSNFKTIPFLQTITSDIQTQVNTKQSLIVSPTANDFVYVNGAGQVIDSGISLSVDGSFASTSDLQTASTKAIQTYVLNQLGGNNPIYEAVAIPTVNINLSNPGTAVFDGVTAVSGDQIFILPAASGGGQTTASQGGIYLFTSSSTALTRIATMNTWNEVVGSRVTIDSGGTVYGGTFWANTNVETGGVIGTTAVTYTQTQQNYVSGIGVIITGNTIAIGQAVAVNSSVTFNSVRVSVNTNGFVMGLTNTTSWTMAALSISRTFTTPDADSNSVVPLGSATTNQWVQWIGTNGVQHLSAIASTQLSDISGTAATNAQILVSNGTSYTPVSLSGAVTINNAGVAALTNASVTGQVLIGFSTSTLGIVTATDTILTALDKVAFLTSNAGFRAQSTSATLLVSDQGQEVQPGANNLTLTLPAASAMKIGRAYGITINTVGFTGTIIATSGNINGQASPFTMSATYWTQGFYTVDGANYLTM